MVLVLWSVSVSSALVVPTATEPKASGRVTTWACAVSIAAASRKKREVRSTRVRMCEERNGGFLRLLQKGNVMKYFEIGPSI